METAGINIFTYGSLMFRPVWESVVRGNYRSTPASAFGYARYAVTGQTYPGMVQQANASVQGLLYRDVTAEDIAALDAFEGDAYRRDCLHVTLDGGAETAASTYIYTAAAGLSDTAWQPGAFQVTHFVNLHCHDRLDK